MDETIKEIIEKLSEPFPVEDISWKPQKVKDNRALAVTYADLRAYERRLDEVVPNWQSECRFTGHGDSVACSVKLTIAGITRAGDGGNVPSGKGKADEEAATIAYAQAFKRACSRFGLGRYMYDLPKTWADYVSYKFTPAALNMLNAMYARETGITPIKQKEIVEESARDTGQPHMITKKGIDAINTVAEECVKADGSPYYVLTVEPQWNNLLKSLGMMPVAIEELTHRRAGVVYWYIKEQVGLTGSELKAQKALGKQIAALAETREIDWDSAKILFTEKVKEAAKELGAA